ncbi:MAG TPA: ribonuclease III [Candidatus Limnocylindria bacterium]|nr:ribonuclease III [Candidatus Limnocylindria bacterium]
MSDQLVDIVAERLGYRFAEPGTLARALTHRSVGGDRENNETLEFLGDAVLALAIADLLMQHHPAAREGELSKLRAGLVNAAVLAGKARALALSHWLRLGRGEEKTGGRDKESILAAAYEAVLGAIFLDGGYQAVRDVVGREFASELAAGGLAGASDYKTRLQELTQRRFRVSPVYRLINEQGPDHAKRFAVELSIDGRVAGRGVGASKKAAEQAAAMEALAQLERGEW